MQSACHAAASTLKTDSRRFSRSFRSCHTLSLARLARCTCWPAALETCLARSCVMAIVATLSFELDQLSTFPLLLLIKVRQVSNVTTLSWFRFFWCFIVGRPFALRAASFCPVRSRSDVLAATQTQDNRHQHHFDSAFDRNLQRWLRCSKNHGEPICNRQHDLVGL